MTEFLNIGEITLKNTTVKKISTNVFDKSSVIELPSAKKVAEIAALANTHDDVVMTDTIYLFDDSTGRIFDNTYNCQWQISQVDNTFYPKAGNYDEYSKLINGCLVIPTYAIYKNHKYTLGDFNFTDIETINLQNITYNSLYSIVKFSFVDSSSLPSSAHICLKSNYFEKAGIDIGFSRDDIELFHKEPSCDSSTSLSVSDDCVERIDSQTFVLHCENLYIDTYEIECKVYGKIPDNLVTYLEQIYKNPSTRTAECIKYKCSSIHGINVNVDKTKHIILSKKFKDTITLTTEANSIGKVMLEYPKIDLSTVPLSTYGGETYFPLHLKINETYLEAGLENGDSVASDDTIMHLWLPYQYFNNEDVETATAKQFGDFSGLLSLQCVHIPKDYLALTSMTYDSYVIHLRTVLCLHDSCKIGFY